MTSNVVADGRDVAGFGRNQHGKSDGGIKEAHQKWIADHLVFLCDHAWCCTALCPVALLNDFFFKPFYMCLHVVS